MSTLYIIATPIGNLEDVTIRALRLLGEVDAILCEDTRVTKKLLNKYDIKEKQLISYHAQSGLAKEDKIFAMIEEGKNLAVVTDAGTPGISDPGSMLVSHIRDHFGDRVKIEPIPGASALTASLSAAGVPASEFLFLGFLPQKKGRNKVLKEIADSKTTIVFYESPHRILKTLTALNEILREKHRVVVARELTKIHEQFVSGTSAEVLEYFTLNPDKVRGEFVVILTRLLKL